MRTINTNSMRTNKANFDYHVYYGHDEIFEVTERDQDGFEETLGLYETRNAAIEATEMAERSKEGSSIEVNCWSWDDRGYYDLYDWETVLED